jgi:hypothetical protein
MIKKELDEFVDTSKYAVAGRKAEEKMAFYLKRFFGNHPNIHVLNHIRLEANDDAAQIDHLVIHPYGLAIVESKSVHGKIQIKDDGQWVRWYGKQSSGMASPLTQAKLQGAFLKDVLNKAATPKDFFNSIPLEIMIAISDEGLILWPKVGKHDQVWKADQIADALDTVINKAISRNQKELLPLKHIEKLCEFLCKSHKPLIRKSIAKAIEAATPAVPVLETVSAEPEINKADFACTACNKTNLEIRFGHSSYFHCLDCEKNSPIKLECPTCKAIKKIRKKKKEFFGECQACETSQLFYVNPA